MTIRRYSQLKNELEDFYSRHNIDPEKMYYLGRGEFGTAYSLQDGRVLKITTSYSEYEIALRMLGRDFSNLVKVFAAEIVNKEYYIITEELEQNADDEGLFYDVLNMLDTQEVPITYIGHFDEEDYIAEHGEIDPAVKTFMDDLYFVVSQATDICGDRADISPDNLGRDSETGELKAFDLDTSR